ncbi:hypothetical protein LUZ60_012761 [Juncus effusus]|nr:hypothetical protein LUZ60_012761 [Juncus effusus]
MKAGGLQCKVETQKLGCGAMVKFLLFAIVVLSVLNPAVLPHSFLHGKISNKWLPNSEEQNFFELLNSGKFSFRLIAKDQNRDDMTDLGKGAFIEIKEESTGFKILKPLFNADQDKNEETESLLKSNENQASKSSEEIHEQNPIKSESSEIQVSNSSLAIIEQNPTKSENTQTSKLTYDSSHFRYNICSIEGDIRILPNVSTVFVISPSPLDPNTSAWKIKPYPRKWESSTMETVSELTIQQLTDKSLACKCDIMHEVPAIVFSTERFMGNLFHDFTDMVYPIFLASHRYNGEVKFVVVDYLSKSMDKFQPYFKHLSHYPIINLDTESLVHCFPSVQIGLQNPGPMGYEPENPKNDDSIEEFKSFIRKGFSLERSHVERGRKPRLLIMVRNGTRSIVNENDVITMAQELGFEVVTADAETTRDFYKISRIANSCDVLMGIHGAGLANLVYLPTNGTLIQIVPWGGLYWVGKFDFGDPARGYGLNYVQYDIVVEESTLIEKYPRDHAMFTDPESIHKQGWKQVYEIFLHEQNIRLDIGRFRGILSDVYQSYQ